MLVSRLLSRFVFLAPEGDGAAAGGAAAAPADGAAAAAAPAGTTPAAGEGAAAADPAAAAAAAAAAQTDNSPSDWRESIADADLKKFVTDKGYKDPAEAFKALRDAEAKHAAPEKPEDYQIGDTDFAKTAATWFHEQGISAEAAKGLTAKWNEYVAQQNEAVTAARTREGEAQMSALKTEWGNSYDTNIELSRQAMRKFGVPVEFIDKVAGQIGDAETVKVFNRIGAAMSEGTLNPGGAGSSGAALTEEQQAAKFYA